MIWYSFTHVRLNFKIFQRSKGLFIIFDSNFNVKILKNIEWTINEEMIFFKYIRNRSQKP